MIISTDFTSLYKSYIKTTDPNEILKDIEKYIEKRNKKEKELEEERVRRMIYEKEQREKREQVLKEKKIFEERQKQEEDKRRLEEQKRHDEEQDKRQKERMRILSEQISAKEKAIKEIQDLFIHNYLISKKVWQNEYSKLLSEEEFYQLSTKFVVDWFLEQGWKVPDNEQARSIAEVWDDIQVVARAGSGKTFTTVNRAAFLIKHCRVEPEKILLLAFNQDAARELNIRLQSMMGESAPKAMTFHALAHAIVRPEEALLYDREDNGFEKSKFIQEIIGSYINNKENYNHVKNIMYSFYLGQDEDYEDLVEQLSPRELVEFRRSLPYVGFDGKSYKSKGEKKIADYLFEHNIPYYYEFNFKWDSRNYKPDFTIPSRNSDKKGIIIEYFGIEGDEEYNALTYKKKKFWTSRRDYIFIELYPEHAKTFTSIDQSLGERLRNEGYINQRLTDYEVWEKIKPYAVDNFYKIISQFIDRCRNSLISPESLKEKIQDEYYSLSNLQYEFLKIAQEIYKIYVNSLHKYKKEDFNGLLLSAANYINSGKGSWERSNGSGDLLQTHFLFIDEYQDFSILFHNLVEAIKYKNPNIKLFCVGDDWQAINGFAGSDLCFFNEFMDYFPNSKKLTISSNRRSTRKIVSVGNSLMEDEGLPSKAISNLEGTVCIAYLDEFFPNTMESSFFKGDKITPLLIRMVYSFTKKGKRVALVIRRNSGLPWYTHLATERGHFQSKYLNIIKKALPKKQGELVSMGTVHSFKGREEEAVIIVDAVYKSYPLIHPNHTFFSILGDTIEKIISEERRLYYVALSRPIDSLIIVTERENESPFVNWNLRNLSIIDKLDVNKLEFPKEKGTHYIVTVSKKDTVKIKERLKSNGYRWDYLKQAWEKSCPVETFSKKHLLNEPWVKFAKDKEILVLVNDEYGHKIGGFSIFNGTIVEF